MGVSTIPGAYAQTRIPYFCDEGVSALAEDTGAGSALCEDGEKLTAHSFAATCVNPLTAHLLAEYVPSIGKVLNDTIDAAPMILPPVPCATICFAPEMYEFMSPPQLTSNILCRSAGVVSRIGLTSAMPALAMRVSRCPRAATVRETIESVCAESETSVKRFR